MRLRFGKKLELRNYGTTRNLELSSAMNQSKLELYNRINRGSSSSTSESFVESFKTQKSHFCFTSFFIVSETILDSPPCELLS